MEAIGRLKDISRNWQTNRLLITFEIEGEPREELNALMDIEKLTVSARKYREKRSLSANAYFHVLAGKIAEKTGEKMTHEKNRLIREYGQWEFHDGKIPTLTMKPEYEDMLLDLDTVHVKPIRRDENSVQFGLMRGSHTYDTAEMSRLIDATVAECKELGIETMPPQELERMKSTWKPER